MKINRRNFLQLGLLQVATIPIIGCGKSSPSNISPTETDTPEITTNPGTQPAILTIDDRNITIDALSIYIG